MASLSKEDIELKALQIVETEIANYKDGEFFITEKVAFAMRPLIRLLRKNYWGVFDQPKDPVTSRDKQWVPLTRVIVDTVRKNADLDLKDISFRANSPEGREFTHIVRGFIRKWLYQNFFGEVLDETVLQLSIDGTVVWKTYTTNKGGKLQVRRKTVDLLNFFIDPTADSIHTASRVTERALMTIDEVKSMKGWSNTDKVKTAPNLHRSETDTITAQPTGEYVDVYEMWGLVPESLITGKDSDTEMVEARIVVSGLQTGERVVHLIERNTNKDKNGDVVKPYEEVRYIKVPGRWYGVGPAEMVLKIQEWVNLIVNLRINKNTNASLGLFKVKASAGVTQQMLSNLVSRGVIRLNNMEDLENLRIDEAGESSYRDEEVAKNWAYEVTSTFDVSRGASLPASTTATSAAIEDRNAKTAFILIKETIGLFLQRWLDRQVLQHVPRMMKQAKAATIYGDFDDIDEIRKRIVAFLAMEQLESMFDAGFVPTEQEVQAAMDDAEKKLRQSPDLFVDIMGEILTEHVDTVAQFTNEEMDIGVTVRNLIDLVGLIPPEAQKDTVMTIYDLLGLQIPESLRSAQMPMDPNQNPMQDPSQPPEMAPMLTEANTMTSNGT